MAKTWRIFVIFAFLGFLPQSQAFQNQPKGPSTFEGVVFLKASSIDLAQANLKKSLATKLATIDRSCQLTSSQKQTLELMGHGDIKRLFDQFFQLENELSHRGWQPRDPRSLEAARGLRVVARSGHFHEHSLLGRSIRKTLNADQLARYEALIREEREARHLGNVGDLMQFLEQAGPWPQDQNKRFRKFLETKIKPAKNSGLYGMIYLAIELGQTPSVFYRDQLPDEQMKALEEYIAETQEFEPALRQAGYFSIEDEEESEPGKPALDTSMPNR